MKSKIWYTIRVFLYAILLDATLHFLYTNGLNNTRLWKADINYAYILNPGTEIEFTPPQVAATGVLTVVYMYIKFMVIWRFFRMWALWDGVNPPENIRKCVVNQYRISDFWKSWHSSMNLWIIRYIYVPIGGSKRRFLSLWIIFTFIALWHEFSTEWLAWAFFNICIFVIEMVGSHIIGATKPIQYIKRISDHKFKPYYNLTIAVGSSVVQTVGILAQLAIMFGFEDSAAFIKRLYGEKEGLFMLAATFLLMFSIGEVALWAQEHERQRSTKKSEVSLSTFNTL